MTQTTMQMAKNKAETAQAANHMKELACKGTDSMHKTAAEMNSFSKAANESVERITPPG